MESKAKETGNSAIGIELIAALTFQSLGKFLVTVTPWTKYLGETLYLFRQGLSLENETIDDATQTIPQTLITVEAKGHRDQ